MARSQHDHNDDDALFMLLTLCFVTLIKPHLQGQPTLAKNNNLEFKHVKSRFIIIIIISGFFSFSPGPLRLRCTTTTTPDRRLRSLATCPRSREFSITTTTTKANSSSSSNRRRAFRTFLCSPCSGWNREGSTGTEGGGRHRCLNTALQPGDEELEKFA